MLAQLKQWEQEAYELGCEHARNAASWVTGGNEDDESRKYKFQLIEDGDPRMDQYLPAAPNLSGEWAGGPTPQSLAVEIAGEELSSVEDESEVIDALSDAYQRGVDETFMPACEAELRKWLQ